MSMLFDAAGLRRRRFDVDEPDDDDDDPDRADDDDDDDDPEPDEDWSKIHSISESGITSLIIMYPIIIQ